MMSRFATVDKVGKFEIRGDQRMRYSIMVATRIGLTKSAYQYLQMALCVATRYAACRRQFKNIPDSSEERKLIDY